jgi:hypothetical protein
MYKTLFFALVTIVLWIGSLILAFFGGAITWAVINDKKKEEQMHYGIHRRASRDPTKAST